MVSCVSVNGPFPPSCRQNLNKFITQYISLLINLIDTEEKKYVCFKIAYVEIHIFSNLKFGINQAFPKHLLPTHTHVNFMNMSFKRIKMNILGLHSSILRADVLFYKERLVIFKI